MGKNTNRNPGADVVRCVALLCVISVHFFRNIGFYAETVRGFPMFLMVVMRSGFMICVPLFMMLTGYLNRNKEPSLPYYLKLTKTLYIYVAASVVCVLYKSLVQKAGPSLLGAIAGLFSFEDAPYAWYIEMYIGLYLLVPFLNALYDSISTQRNRQCLLAVLFILTGLPSVLNIFCLAGPEWWIMPSSSASYFPLVPQWWTDLYPITYFYLGCYLRDYPLKRKPRIHGVLILLVFGFAGVFNIYRSYGSTFVWGPWQDYGSFLIMIQAVLVFSVFTERRYDGLSCKMKTLFARISDLSLGAYLSSWVFDQYFYTKLAAFAPEIYQKLYYFPVMVFAVLIGSLLVSALINFSYAHTLSKILSGFLAGQKTNAA